MHILDCVVAVKAAGDSAFAHRCDGSLWCVARDIPVFVMDAVAYFYISTEMHMREALAIQTDNSLWAIHTTVRARPPRHLMDDVAAVFTAWYSAFILQTNGSLWAMGNNSSGNLGDGTTVNRQSPVRIMDSVVYVHPPSGWEGATHAILEDGSLWSWGGRRDERNNIVNPSPEHVMDGVAAVYSSLGRNFALRTDGSLWVWGDVPVHVMDNVTAVYPGKARGTYITRADGSIWAFGFTPDGLFRLGQPHDIPANISYGFSYAAGGGAPPGLGYTPDVPFSPALNREPPFIAGTSWHQLYVDSYARLWLLGHERPSGLDGAVEAVNSPYFFMDNVLYANMNIGHWPYALQESGDLWNWPWFLAWGTTTVGEPEPIMGDVAAFYEHFSARFAIRNDGSLHGWGSNWSGLLPGAGNYEHHLHPVPIMESVAALHLSNNAAFAHRYDGSLWSWGANEMGVLGDSRDTSSLFFAGVLRATWNNPYPEPEAALHPAQVMSDVAIFRLQGHSAFAIQTCGSLWAWGDNSAGQLGDGTRQTRYYPVLIMDGVVDIQTTGASTFAIRADGSLWAWGWNSQGQLGDGTLISRSSPVRIMDGVQELYLAPGASFAIKHNGSLWAWGGRFGPTPAPIMNGAARVFSRPDYPFSHYVIDQTGSLWVLENNQNRPQFVMYTVADVFFGTNVMFALRQNGELWTWGNCRHRGYIGRDEAVKIEFEI